MKIDPTKLLMVYSAVLTVGAVGMMSTGGAVAQSGGATSGKASFDTIDVKRINIREDDGTLRLVVSNTSRAPGIIMRGKERPHPSGNRGAGFIFYNNEGTENGGLIFSGERGPDGKTSGTGHLSFDQYEQDQVIQLTQSEQDGKRMAAMIVNDRPDTPLDFETAERVAKMPAGPEKDAVYAKLKAEGWAGRQRLYAGKSRDKSSAVALSDGMGRPRLMMRVAEDGAATIEFMDEKGKVVRTISPTP